MSGKEFLAYLQRLSEKQLDNLVEFLDFKKDNPNLEFERIELTIDAAGKEVAIPSGTKTETKHKYLIGVNLNSTDTDALLGSTIKLAVDTRQFFDGEEARVIYASDNVSPDERFFTYVNGPLKESSITGYYKDSSDNYTAPYKVTLLFACINGDK